jgi:hypothetical protein
MASSVGTPYASIMPAYLNAASLVKNYFHQLDCSWHPIRLSSFASRTEISNFSRTLLRHFRRTISDATGDRSEVTYLLGSGDVLLTLFGPAESSITGITLVCSSGIRPTLVCKCPRPCYRGAVFIGDDLAVDGSPRSCAPDGQGAIFAPVQQGRQPHTVGSSDEHE